MTFVPFHQVVAATGARPRSTCFVLHGIFGSGRNWRTFAQRWADACPQWRLVLVDLRNHGRSQGAPPPHTLAAAADDLAALAEYLGGPPEAVCGHSFGGKVAIVYAQRHPAALRTLIALDSPPGAFARGDEAPRQTEAWKALQAMRRLAMPVASRAEAGRRIEAAGVDAGVARWMATNLVPRDGGGFTWHFDLDALDAMLEDYWRVDGYPLLESPPPGLRIHVVRAERSDRFTGDDLERLTRLARDGCIDYAVLPDAGHWLHVDNPDGLLELVTPMLPR